MQILYNNDTTQLAIRQIYSIPSDIAIRVNNTVRCFIQLLDLSVSEGTLTGAVRERQAEYTPYSISGGIKSILLHFQTQRQLLE
jgi:hypothetical protein